jgi:predicted RNA-binding protein with PUA-like domain
MNDSSPQAHRYWLMKNEPDEYSIDHALASPNRPLHWNGVRNYRHAISCVTICRQGDGVLYWHSSCAEPGIYGCPHCRQSAVWTLHSSTPQTLLRPQVPERQTALAYAGCAGLERSALLMPELREQPQLAQMRVLQKAIVSPLPQ